MRDESWRGRALCAQVDPETFYPAAGETAADARRICKRCEVRQQCLDFALANNEAHGVWGGFSERDRRRLKLGHVIPVGNICPYGHDKDQVGTYNSGECRQCNLDRSKKRKLTNLTHGTRAAYKVGCRCDLCRANKRGESAA